MQSYILDVRKGFALFMKLGKILTNMIAKKSKKDRIKKAQLETTTITPSTRRQRRQLLVLNITNQALTQASENDKYEQVDLVDSQTMIEVKFVALLNVYIALHFSFLIFEYDLL